MSNRTGVDVYDDEKDLLRLYEDLRVLMQSYRNTVAIERNKFDKSYNEKRARETQEKYDIDFDNKFSSYGYHIQSIRRCREKIVNIDDALFSMRNSFADPFFYIMDKDPNIQEHCVATKASSLEVILYLDAVMKNNELFQVYKIFQLLRALVTYLDNWIFVLSKTIDNLGQAYNDMIGDH